MQRTTSSRLGARIGAASVAAVTSVALVGLTYAPASAATPEVTSGASWLAGELTGGTIHNNEYNFDDWGLTIDTALALKAAGTQSAAVTSIRAALNAGGVNAYVKPGYGTVLSGAGVAKALVAARVTGASATSFGGNNLVTELQGLIVKSGTKTGRVADRIDSTGTDYGNNIGQAFAVEGLASAGVPSAAATSFLLKQQCSAGYFRLANNDGKTCSAAGTGADSDTTSFALQALLSAKQDGASGLDTAISKATNWLVSAQKVDGSYGGSGPTSASNSNSTGLAAQALRAAGRSIDAAQAVTWLKALQVTAANAGGGLLKNDIGAVAYNSAAFEDAKTPGIDDSTSDQWRRASAQALLGFSGVSMGSLLPAPTKRALSVSVATSPVKGGTSAEVRVSGLATGETFSVKVGSTTRNAVATASGAGAVSVPVARSTATLAVSVRGLTSGRTGSTTVKVLGAKHLKPKLKKSKVHRSKKQKVTIKHLWAGEHVTVKYRGHRISTKSAHANSHGVYALKFKVGKKTGKHTVKVRGAFSNRDGKKSFKVIR